MPTIQRKLSRVAVAALATACAAVLRHLLEPLVGFDFPYVLFFASIASAAWFGKFGGGVWATGFSGVVSWYFFVPPELSFNILSVKDAVGLVLFVMVGIAVSACVEFTHRARSRAASEAERRHAEGERTNMLVRANEANLADFLEHANVGVHSVDEHGTILRCNREEMLIMGYAADEYVGRNIAEFHVDPAVVNGMLERLRRREVVRDCRSQVRCKDGTIKHVMINSTARWDGDQFVHSRCFTLDISDRVAVEGAELRRRESDLRFEMIADNLSVMAWTADQTGKPTWYNRRWYEFTGLTRDEINDGGWRGLHHPDHIDRVTASVRESRERGVEWEDTFPLRGSDGEYRWFLSRLVPIRDAHNAIVRWFGTSVDITRRMAMEAELRAADRRKDEFVATLAHELRNPLAPLQHALQVIEWRNGGDADVGRMVGIMQRQVTQMSRLVDDLIELSRMSQGRMTLRRQHLDVVPLIENAVESMRPTADRAGVTINVVRPYQPIVIDADEIRITQMLTNLLANACKFSRPGGTARIETSAGDGRMRIVVSDNGIGISAQRLPHVFELFSQGHELNEYSRGGLGIGLTLVRGIVELHGGEVEARSDGVDRGCTFIVSLPLAVEAGSARTDERTVEPVDAVAGATQRPCRVLIADDNPDGVHTLSTLLRMHGYEVTATLDGRSALRAFQTSAFDVAILDIGMPGLSGYAVCQQLRELPGGRDALVIALTGWGEAKDRERSREVGFDVHLVKPVDRSQLVRVLNERVLARA